MLKSLGETKSVNYFGKIQAPKCLNQANSRKYAVCFVGNNSSVYRILGRAPIECPQGLTYIVL